MQELQWYPGHMAKAKRQLEELIRYLDVILEVRDARLPLASHNSDLDGLLERKPNIVVFTKSDLADPAITKEWVRWFAGQDKPVIEVNGKSGQGVSGIWPALSKQCSGKKIGHTIKAGVVGVPNVGKSSILNRLLGTTAAKTGNMPGVTRGKQWVRRNGFDILDTPGLLPPKFATQEEGLKLVLIGTIRDEIVPVYDLALRLFDVFGTQLRGIDFAGDPELTAEEKLARFAEKRGFLIKGGELDVNRAVTTLLKEFRDGKYGRITLEQPPG